MAADELAERLAAGTDVAFDARTEQRYCSGDPDLDPRPGHIPGAVSAPWAGNLAADGRFRSPDELRTRFAAGEGLRAVAYCGSGVTACHDLLAMTRAGLTDIALYPGSWSQWAADPDRPAATGGAADADLHRPVVGRLARLPERPPPPT